MRIGLASLRWLLLWFAATSSINGQEWQNWGGDPGGSRYSPISQVNRENVKDLKQAWVFHTGDLDKGVNKNFGRGMVPAFETTPLVVDGVMYLSTPTARILALNAETGRKLWEYDGAQARPFRREGRWISRGFCALILIALAGFLRWRIRWTICSACLIVGAITLFLVLKSTGRLQTTRYAHPHRGVAYWQSSDGTDKRILFGSSWPFQAYLTALDARTGKPMEGFGTQGVVDLRAGVADEFPLSEYLSTSPPAIYKDLAIMGAELPENPSHGPSGDVRAFNVRTGEVAWTFHSVPQTGEPGNEQWERNAYQNRTGVNVWSLMSVDRERGIVFLPFGSAAYDFYGADRKGPDLYANSLVALDAATGKVLWHYQLVHHDIWDYDLPAQPILTTINRDGVAIPAVVQITKMGFVFVLNRVTGEPLFPIKEVPVPQSKVPGEASWPTQPFPLKPPPLSRQSIREDEIRMDSRVCRDLLGGARKGDLYTPYDITATLQTPGELGGGNWSGGSVDLNGRLFVNTNNVFSVGKLEEQKTGSSERYLRNNRARDAALFWDADQTPCQNPPWGMLSGVDLAGGTIAWQTPLNVPNIGGSIVTAGGLVFLGATTDDKFRAFDSATGRELWSAQLEASAHANPMTYMGKTTGLQYIAIAAGGGGIFKGKVSDAVMVFSLPRR